MSELLYTINPLLMGGLVKEVKSDCVKVHLHGRLGVITVPHDLIIGETVLEPGHEAQFYFSYIQINEQKYDYDCQPVKNLEFEPSYIGGTIIEVNDTAIKVQMMENLGTVAVPRRWAFTSLPLEEGQNVEFYFSPMKIIGKRDIPVEMI